MNCEDFNKAVLAEPDAETPARQAHVDVCPDCARLQTRVRRMDRQLAAILAVPVPSSVERGAADIEALAAAAPPGGDDRVVALSSRRPRAVFGGWPAFAGLAAAVVLVGVFVLRPAGVTGADGAALADEVVAHMQHEMFSMRPASTAVTDDALTAALAPAGVRLRDGGAPGLVSYAKSCVIDGKLVPHLVIQGEAGPVTVLVMPDQPVDGPVSIMQGGLEGVIVPAGDGGSIAIIGRDAASVEAVRESAGDGLGFVTT